MLKAGASVREASSGYFKSIISVVLVARMLLLPNAFSATLSKSFE